MTRSSENPEVTPTVSVPKKGALNIAQSDARPTRHMAVFFVSPDKRLFPRFTVRADSEFAPSLRETPSANITPITGKLLQSRAKFMHGDDRTKSDEVTPDERCQSQ